MREIPEIFSSASPLSIYLLIITNKIGRYIMSFELLKK